MDINRRSVLSCRGCLKEVNEDQFYSFVRQEHKDLFTECTAIKVRQKAPVILLYG